MTAAHVAPFADSASGRQHFLRELFVQLEATSVRYAILHGGDRLDTLVSDIDLIVHRADRYAVGRAFGAMLKKGYAVIHCCEYAADGYRFDFGWVEAGELVTVGIDVAFSFRIDGVAALHDVQLLQGTVKKDGYSLTSDRSELLYLVAKKASKLAISREQLDRVRQLSLSLGSELNQACAELVGEQKAAELARGCREGDLAHMLRDIRSSILRHCGFRAALEGRWRELGRAVRRCVRPNGYFIVALGPDGSGKDTLLEILQRQLSATYRTVSVFHWRYGAIRKLDKARTVADARRRPAHSALVSAILLVLTVADYFVGYWTKARPRMARSGLVMFNRHAEDMYIDPRRYRYSGSRNLLRLLAHLVPPRQRLVLVFDAEPSVIRARKPELDECELRQLRTRYLDLARRLSAPVIDTGVNLEESVHLAWSAILPALQERARFSSPQWARTA